MSVTPIAFDDKRGRKRFIAAERELMSGEPLHVREIERDVNRYLAGDSPFYEEMDHALFVAGDGDGDGADVARCAALVNRRWQRDKRERAGFIGYFAAAPQAGAEVSEMLETAEGWLAERGADRVIAPFNGATFHGLGVLCDAFDDEPIFPLPWQPPHYLAMLEAAGYRPTYPVWVFDVDFSSERYRTASTRALDDARCTVRTLDKKRWDAELEELRLVFNDTFRDEWEFHQLTGDEFHEFFDDFKAVLDERQFLFAEVDSEIAGFCFGIPDWTPLFRSLKGKMGPLQILRLLLRAKRFDRAGLISLGVRDAHRGKHIGQTLAATLYRYYEERGLAGSFYYPVNDGNLASRRLAESLGGRGRVLYRCYDKPLTAAVSPGSPA